ncbi:ABC transporter permease [Bradyrhizobium prioriisuperbiae]|uniref:ABC transporter permease n=1 Tax=Bradyrhizobium prioriisuperbiae TaxID=2854389 RepID=UPI0028ED4941|nr:ABC transporter permease [Bradyrhizobium prioritasuperba]
MHDFFLSFYSLIPTTVAQSLIYAFVALGLMIPFRLLDLPDLTCEGSFPLGGCMFAASAAAGLSPTAGTAAAVIIGFAAGVCTAYIHLKFRIHTLLAGIILFTIVWSVDLRVMGRPNIPVDANSTLFGAINPSLVNDIVFQMAVTAIFLGGGVLALDRGLRTEVGLRFRCVGTNQRLSPALGINLRRNVLVGFGIANALVALGGALAAQAQGYADVTMGFGILINGLAALIIGETLIGTRTIGRQLLAPVVGSLIYYQLISAALATGIGPSDLKLATGLFVLLTLAAPVAFESRARRFANS